MELFLNDKLGKIECIVEKSSEPKAFMIFSHGAGAGMHHSFMKAVSASLVEQDIAVARFNFPYMQQGRKSPGSPKSNIEAWKLVVEHIQSTTDLPIFLSGKSYGGRMASHLLAEKLVDNIAGLIYFGFPLHAPGRDSKDRAAHLSEVIVPQLFLQGSNDKLANLEMIKEVVSELSEAEIAVYDHADHSFNVPKKSGKTKEEMMDELVSKAATWMKGLV